VIGILIPSSVMLLAMRRISSSVGLDLMFLKSVSIAIFSIGIGMGPVGDRVGSGFSLGTESSTVVVLVMEFKPLHHPELGFLLVVLGHLGQLACTSSTLGMPGIAAKAGPVQLSLSLSVNQLLPMRPGRLPVPGLP